VRNGRRKKKWPWKEPVPSEAYSDRECPRDRRTTDHVGLVDGSIHLSCPFCSAPGGVASGWLARRRAPLHSHAMFVVTEADAAAIRAVFDQEGELSAAIEVRRLFPGVIDNAKARAHARTIAGWKPLPVPVTRLHPHKRS
jgi:hypothetical protein